MKKNEEFAEAVAHELNNIFMIINVSLEMLREQSPKDEKTNYLFAAAIDGIKRGTKLNRQLLAFTRGADLDVLAEIAKISADKAKTKVAMQALSHKITAR